MTDRNLLRVLGVAAMLGGSLRIASAFVRWRPGSATLELFYLLIDLLLLFGLMGAYLAHRSRLGIFGFVGFVVAEAGIASIVGPDATVFGIDTYATGVVVIMTGLTMLSVQMLAANPYGVLFARATDSSGVRKVMVTRTGPKISTCAIVEDGCTSVNRVGG